MKRQLIIGLILVLLIGVCFSRCKNLFSNVLFFHIFHLNS